MPQDDPVNFQMQRPSRGTLHPGDVFTMRLPDDRHLFGRVVRTDATCFAPGCILVYIFTYLADHPAAPARLLVDDLLVPPATINRLGWSRGYLMTIDRRPFDVGERLPAHYFISGRRGPKGERLFVDEDGQPVGQPPPGTLVGQAGLGNYRTLDDDVSRALGIPLAPQSRDR